MRKKRLLFIIWSLSCGGGAEKQLVNILNLLNKNKYEIDVIEYLHCGVCSENINNNINILPPINNKVTESKFKRKLCNVLVYLFPKLLRKVYIKKEYDYEISFNYLIPTFLLSNNKDSKKICFIHGSIWDLKYKRKFILKILQKKHLKRADYIVPISESTKISIVNIYPALQNKLNLINNGYDFKTMENKSLEKKIERKAKIELLYCNRFDQNKNPKLLIDAVKILKNEKIDFHLNMLGEGELQNLIKDEIKNNDLTNEVSLLGYVSNPFPYIAKCDIICLSSLLEGFSTFLIEGLYFKKPFVSTSGAIPFEIKDKNCGIIVETSEEYARAIISLYNDEKKYEDMANNGYDVAKTYSLSNQVAKLERLLN